MQEDEAIMQGDGGPQTVETAPRQSLLAVLAELSPIDDDFSDIDDPVPTPVDL